MAYIDEIPEQYLNGYLGNMLPGLASASPQMAINLYESLDSGMQVRLRRRTMMSRKSRMHSRRQRP